MAKKKTEDAQVDAENYFARIEAEIRKDFGDGILVSGADIVSNPPTIIPVSPSLDSVLGGGISEGSIVVSSGKPKCGKTSVALKFAANCQKPEFGNRHVYWHDVEMRLETRNLIGTHGLNYNPERFTVFKSSRSNILTAEKHLSIAEKVINTHPGSLVVIDSLSALCNEKEFVDEITGNSRSVGPKLIASFMRRISNVARVNNVVVWCMLHFMSNTSGYGASLVEDSGNKIQYFLSYKIQAKSTEEWKVGEKSIGLKTTWRMACSALEGGIPGSEAATYLRYGYGLDDVVENIELGTNLGLIDKSGAWYNFNDQKFQGKEALYVFLKDNPETYNLLNKQVRSMLYGEEVVA